MTQHEAGNKARVVHKYDADTLGAPFSVTLVDSVSLRKDPTSGEDIVRIPDVVGLVNAVVRSRVCHKRKLNHEELKFVRKSLGVKASKLAEFLEMSPEHYSRCEGGTKTMSLPSEKILRMFAYIATHFKDPVALLENFGRIERSELRPTRQHREWDIEFPKIFISMKIEAIFDPDERLHFEFSRHPADVDDGAAPEDGNWSDTHKLAA